MNIASIDIGTNTVLLLIAEINQNGNFKKIGEQFYVARLGENVDKTGIINPQAIERCSNILMDCKQHCDMLNVEKIYACGTSALRDATNSMEVVDIFSNIIGTELKVISGEEEARLSFIGTVNDNSPSLVIDIGGGSTELIIGENSEILNRISLNIGAVRLTERFFSNQPPQPDEIDNAKKFILDNLSRFELNSIKYKTYAVAGTATSIATSIHGLDDHEVEKIHLMNFDRMQIDDIFKKYTLSSTDEIITKYKIHPKRADLITAGTLILKTVCDYFNIDNVIVSSHGLRYGIMQNEINKLI